MIAGERRVCVRVLGVWGNVSTYYDEMLDVDVLSMRA
jgi:hypothetical protein